MLYIEYTGRLRNNRVLYNIIECTGIYTFIPVLFCEHCMLRITNHTNHQSQITNYTDNGADKCMNSCYSKYATAISINYSLYFSLSTPQITHRMTRLRATLSDHLHEIHQYRQSMKFSTFSLLMSITTLTPNSFADERVGLMIHSSVGSFGP